MNEMKVLHICWDLGQGGIQRYLVDLLSFHKERFSSRVIVLSTPGALSEEVSGLCEGVDYVGMSNGLDASALMRILKLLKAHDYDVIHTHANNAILALALKFQSGPVLFTEHGGRLLNRDRGALLFYKYLSSNIDRFIAISQYMADMMCAENASIHSRIKVIHNGVDYDHIVEACRAGTVVSDLPVGQKVGFVGRLTSDKGIDLFIETARLVHAERPEVAFIVVGEGPAKEEMQVLVESYGLEESVHFLGYRKDAREIIGSLNLCLFTSRYEGFGLVVAESLAAGVPVVAMDERSAVSELIRNGVEGVLVKGLDTSGAAKEVIRLLDDPDLMERMSSAGRDRAKEFTIARNADLVAEEYLKLMETTTT